MIVYDSLYSRYSQFEDFVFALCRNVDAETLSCSIPPVQAQTIGYDCGPFAIAFACDLSANINSTHRQYNAKDLKGQILEMIHTKKAKVMSRERGSVALGDIMTRTIELQYIYRLPDISGWRAIKNVFTLKCSFCHILYRNSWIQNIPKFSIRKHYAGINWHCKREGCQRRPEGEEDGIVVTLQKKRNVWHTVT